MKSLLGALCIALAIALVIVLWVTTSSEFWHVNITGVLLFVATVALVGSTIALWLSAERSTQTTERAYVKMSHTPPGAIFEPAKLKVEVQIKNAGRTPASLKDLLLRHVVMDAGEDLPPQPNYGATEPETKEAFLAARDKIYVSRSFDMTTDEVEAVRRGSRRLVIYGYVDYVDVFENYYRAGYARAYERSRDIWRPREEKQFSYSCRQGLQLRQADAQLVVVRCRRSMTRATDEGSERGREAYCRRI